jgi:small GTP-binding protein
LEFDNKAVKLQIWDTAGQERFRTITSAYYKNAQGIILVFDLKVKKTLENVEQFWMDEVKKYAEKEVQIVVVGNKADCEDVEVTEEDMAAFTLKHGVPCLKVSAKSGDGVETAFDTVARNCVKEFGQLNHEDKNSVVDDIRKKKAEFKLKTGKQEQAKKKCC